MFKQKKHLAFLMAVVFFAASLVIPAPVSAAAGIPVAVTGFSMSQNVITAGQTITIRVTTTIAANSVVAAYDGTTRAGVMESDNGSIKSWAIVINPATSQTIKVYVGATAEVNALTTTLDMPITVNGSAQTSTSTAGQSQPAAQQPVNSGASIIDIQETSVGKTVTLTVRTGPAANDTWVRFDGSLYVKGVLGNSDASGKTWTIRFNPSAIQTVTVSANTSYATTGADNNEYPIAFTSSIAPPARASISSITASRSLLYTNESVALTIYTNSDAEYVWVEYNNGQIIPASIRSGYSGSNKTWTATITPNGSQTIRALANIENTTDDAVSRSYSITVRTQEETSGRARAEIQSNYTAEWEEDEDDASNGDDVEILVNVTTNSYANYVWFVYDGDTYRMSRTSSSSNKWKYDGDVDFRRSETRLTIYVSESSRTSEDDSQRVTIKSYSGSSSNNDDEETIYSFKADPDDEVEEKNEIEFTIETSPDIEKVFIFDSEDGDEDDFSSGEYADIDDDDMYEERSNGRLRWTITMDAPSVSGDEDVTFYVLVYTDENADEDEHVDEDDLELLVTED